MIDGIILALSPFILNGVTALAVLATGFSSTAGKRVVLAAFALIGVIATAAVTGTPVDPASVNYDVGIIGTSFVAFLMAHGSYHLFFKGGSAPAAPANLPTLG
jgi:hypothetical protein